MSIHELPAVLVRQVGGFLCWLDRTALRNTNRYALACFDSSFLMTGNAGFRAILVRHLNDLGVDGEYFCSLLKKHKCVISGSVVLQCMLGVSWRRKIPEVALMYARQKRPNIPSRCTQITEEAIIIWNDDDGSIVCFKHPMLGDINVFQIGTPCSEEKGDNESLGHEPEQAIRKYHNCSTAGCFPFCYTFGSAVRGKSPVSAALYVGDGKDIRVKSGFDKIMNDKWVCADSLINVVTLDPQQLLFGKPARISNYIDKYFDLNFLKNVFDGTNLYIRDMDSVMSRSCTIDTKIVAYLCETRDRHVPNILFVDPKPHGLRYVTKLHD